MAADINKCLIAPNNVKDKLSVYECYEKNKDIDANVFWQNFRSDLNFNDFKKPIEQVIDIEVSLKKKEIN